MNTKRNNKTHISNFKKVLSRNEKVNNDLKKVNFVKLTKEMHK